MILLTPVVYYTLRCPNGSFWFQTKAPISVKASFKPVKGSVLLKDEVTSVEFDPTNPMGCVIVATTADGTKVTWFLDPKHLSAAGDHKTDVGLTGTLSVTIK